ncbi:hypothetical protein U9M48_005015 [Paspalum notatum var. saurae]|uniref:Uncharacterized protein n=1 Tax=Paspalum notatum var. saurae TaxID=547442 RepID=A0AAQ3PR89_PASNO
MAWLGLLPLERRHTCSNLRRPFNTNLDANALDLEQMLWLFISVSLEHLEHLDLSMNNLGGETSPMPRFLASMRNLRYLNLYGIYFAGTVPPQFINLSRLQYLDLGNTVRSTDITVFTNLPALQQLCLNGMDLSSINDWPQKLNTIPSLRVVDLSYCWHDRADQKLPYFNLTKLEKHDLSVSDFNHTIASCWFWKAKGLKHLYL